MAFFKFINMGGVVNWILFVIAVICAAQILERAIYFFQTKKGAQNSPRAKLQKKSNELKNMPIDESEKNQLLENEAQKIIFEMGRSLWLLNFFSNAAPTLGLLGTIAGLIKAFQGMATSGATEITSFASGIWEAMLTTATGLIIAIPTSLCYRFFLRLIERRTQDISLFEPSQFDENSFTCNEQPTQKNLSQNKK